MNDFKPGDRVEVVAADMAYGSYKNGDILTIKTAGKASLYMEEFDAPYVRPREVRHFIPAPDVLTIDRAELPEVVESGNLFGEAGGSKFDMVNATEGWWRNRALEALAIAEFLAAREKAEQDAADQHAAILNKRRDELAREFSTMEAIIDYAIQLEGEAKK